MERKYEFTGETKLIEGVELRRIVAARSFGKVSKGDLGGWIQSTFNLSLNGNCWVFDESAVYDHASITENAIVEKGSLVYGRAAVRNDAIITTGSRVHDGAVVSGNAVISDYSEVLKNGFVFDHARIENHSVVTDAATVCESALVSNHTIIGMNAFIRSYLDYIVVGPTDSYGNMITFYKSSKDDGTSYLVVHDGDGHVWDIGTYKAMTEASAVHNQLKRRILDYIDHAREIFGMPKEA